MTPLRLVLKALALGLAVVPLLLTVLVTVPDGNDFALATLDKHARLATTAPRRLIFIGGSNLAYGLDSAKIERELGFHVVNMGMNAYLGMAFVLEEIRREVRRGDVVVLSFEYDMYYEPIDGYGRDILMLVKVRPASLRYLRTARQWLGVARNVPFAAQQKSLRLIRNLVVPERTAPAAEGCDVIDTVESRAGFNTYGDLVSHLGLSWPCSLGRPNPLEGRPLNEHVWPLLQAFRDEIRGRGAQVLLLPPPLAQSYYEAERPRVDAVYTQLQRRVGIGAASPMQYVWPDSYFFDWVYHPTAEGRQLRTTQVIADLKAHVNAGRGSKAVGASTSATPEDGS